MNKTELTKRKLHGYGFKQDKGFAEITFGISSNIKKINRLFPTFQIYDECFKADGFGMCYIHCKISSDYKEVTSITFIIDEFKYQYKAEINGENIFNEEELNLIKDEALRIIDNARYVIFESDLDLRMNKDKLRRFISKVNKMRG